MVTETLDLIQEVFGVEKKQLLAQFQISSNGLKYVDEHTFSDKKNPRQVRFYNMVRSYLDQEMIKKLGHVVKRHYLTSLRDQISRLPEHIHRTEVLTIIDKLLSE